MKSSVVALICLLSPMMGPPVIRIASAANPIDVIPVEKHHVIELNSGQPYVAGFHVKTSDLRTRCTLNASSITVRFPLVNTAAFPETAWLGGGMFVQAQDSRFLHVDYGFYTMLVIDAEGKLYVDLGLYQTREVSQPFQNPPSKLIYAHTWRIVTSSTSIPVTLSAHWDQDGNVHYSMFAEQTNVTLTVINIPRLPNCEHIIRRFYAGNAIANPFPVSTYVQYFQFGVVSSQIISSTPWVVSLKNPMMLKTGWAAALGERWKDQEVGWTAVDHAWTIQGDNAFLDADWKWGGSPYPGVDAEVQSPSEDAREVLFSYTGHTLEPESVLWTSSDPTLSHLPFKAYASELNHHLSYYLVLLIFLGIIISGMYGRLRPPTLVL